jgi:hypothetical protein
MHRVPRILNPVSSLAGQLSLRGLRWKMVATNGGDYDGISVTIHNHSGDYHTLWHLAHQDPLFWAFRLIAPDGRITFQSAVPLRTREGVSPLVPAHAAIPLLHITTPIEIVADYVANFDYACCERRAHLRRLPPEGHEPAPTGHWPAHVRATD